MTSLTSSSFNIIDHFRPLRSPPRRHPSEYDMDELEPLAPMPEDDLPRRRIRPSSRPSSSLPRSPSPDYWLDRTSSAGSSSKSRTRALFQGPPPPIAASKLLTRNAPNHHNDSTAQSLGRSVRAGVGSLLADHRYDQEQHIQPDSVWRGLRRREKALEVEVQQLLNLQASELIKGSEAGGSERGEDDQTSTGSSTPTGTFYSSKSRLTNSLYIPPRAAADGSVIPVRQPKQSKPRGLQTARTGIRKALAGFAQVKAEEDAHIDSALAQRKQALVQLEQLRARREDVSTELTNLEDNEEEPLGQEMRELAENYDGITQEIRQMEEKLVAMRNKRRWLREKMEDVKNRREAGLSGYRGALKDVNAEITTMVRRPPIQPLDLVSLHVDDGLNGQTPSSGGLEFLRLIPERRTLDMAKAWWESEVSILERRKEQIERDRQALEDGGALWADIVSLVSDYESRLRKLIKGEAPSQSCKGKEKELSQEDIIRSQLPEMENVIQTLEAHFQYAQDQHWNLLIAATGAELEAFSEAFEVLKSAVGEDDTEASQEQSTDEPTHEENESSDNEVPGDLLVSKSYDTKREESQEEKHDLQRVESEQSGKSENEVPPEFLAEHSEGI